MGPDDSIQRLRDAFLGGAARFMGELEAQVRGYEGVNVDGHVVENESVAQEKRATWEFLRESVLPKLNAADGLRLLDLLLSYGVRELEGERGQLETRLGREFPPPPANTPLWDWLRTRTSKSGAKLSGVGGPLGNAHFVEVFRKEKVRLPGELLALYAAADGFDVEGRGSSYGPVFGLIESRYIDLRDEDIPFSARATCFHGGENVLLSVYVDEADVAWLVYEYESDPISQIPFDLENLLSFAVRRAEAPHEQLAGALSWESFFETAEIIDDTRWN